MRLHGDAQLPRRGITRDDRKRVDRTRRYRSVRLEPDRLRQLDLTLSDRNRARHDHERDKGSDPAYGASRLRRGSRARFHLASTSTPPTMPAATLNSQAMRGEPTKPTQP